MKLLLEKNANINVKDRFGDPPLHMAAYVGNGEITKLLLAHGADVNKKGACGELALHWATFKGNLEVVEVLLAAGSRVKAGTEGQRVDIDTATSPNYDPIEGYLQFLSSVEAQRRAAARGSSLQIGGPSRLAFALGDSPLHCAAQWGHKRIVRLLIEAGADVNAVNKFGQTALHYASVFFHKQVVAALLESRADVNVADKNGRTSLELALTPKGLAVNEVAELLVNYGAQK